MTEERRQMWADYFAHLANRMELRDWRIKVMPEPAEPDDGAAFKGYLGKKACQIFLNSEWETYEPEKQREYAVHELVHAHMHQPDIFIEEALDSYLSKHESAHVYKAFDHLMEFSVDALAKALAPFLPLPGQVIPELGPQGPTTTPAKELDEETTTSHA